MRLLAVLFITCALRLTSGGRFRKGRSSRESKWDIIHHEYHGPPAPLADDGRVVDTPEVAKARWNHLAIHAETVADLAKKMAELALDKASESSKADEPSELMTPVVEEAMEQKEEDVALVAESDQEDVDLSENDEAKPVEEDEVTNQVDSKQPATIQDTRYEGPLAPIGEDGRVLDTPEVRRAKEAHLLAYQQAAELTKVKEEPEKKDTQEDLEWYEIRNRIYLPSAPVHLLYSQDGPVGYRGPSAPIGEYGHVVDTPEVERAKTAHRKAHAYAQSLAKRHLPIFEDNAI